VLAPRPPVTVIVPFFGAAEEGEELLAALGGLTYGPDDAAIVVDNSPEPRVPAPTAGPLRVVHAAEEHSSYYARNVGAALAQTPWLLFLDSDTRPLAPDLLDAYFDPAPADGAGALAGRVLGAPAQTAVMARHARSRRRVDQELALAHPHRPFGLTANLLVRRAAWEDVGGFCEGIRSGGDQDFGWRLQDGDWALEHRAAAAVEHLHREELAPALRQVARYGAGTAWLTRRHGAGADRRPRLLPGLVRHGGAALVFALTGQRERSLFKAIDLVVLASVNVGFLLENRARRSTPAAFAAEAPLVADELPTSEGHVPEHPGHVEARRRPRRPQARLVRGRDVVYAEDDGYARRFGDALWLARRHPAAALATGSELVALAPPARRLQGAERLVTLAGAGVADAQRLARLLDLPGAGGHGPRARLAGRART